MVRMEQQLFPPEPLLGSNSLPMHDAHAQCTVLDRRSGEPGSESDARA